jgi:hypothetical protein
MITLAFGQEMHFFFQVLHFLNPSTLSFQCDYPLPLLPSNVKEVDFSYEKRNHVIHRFFSYYCIVFIRCFFVIVDNKVIAAAITMS